MKPPEAKGPSKKKRALTLKQFRQPRCAGAHGANSEERNSRVQQMGSPYHDRSHRRHDTNGQEFYLRKQTPMR